jgi:hypothetical protein
VINECLATNGCGNRDAPFTISGTCESFILTALRVIHAAGGFHLPVQGQTNIRTSLMTEGRGGLKMQTR